jgi:hypothetical protein
LRIEAHRLCYKLRKCSLEPIREAWIHAEGVGRVSSSGPLTFECGNCGIVVLQHVHLCVTA